MVKFDPPIWIKPQGENTDVIVFGKSPEQAQADSESGRSRFGGKWRQPSYLQAYLRSARILFSEGMNTGTLDDIGLPIFYLQRHVAELLLKRLLSWVFDIVELNDKLSEPSKDVPTKKQNDPFNRSHSLNTLLDDLKVLTKSYNFDETPASLDRLVKLLTKSKMTETWSRYSMSSKKETVFKHVEDEHIVPIKEIQETIERAVSDCLLQNIESEEVYEYTLYNEWLTKARETGNAG